MDSENTGNLLIPDKNRAYQHIYSEEYKRKIIEEYYPEVRTWNHVLIVITLVQALLLGVMTWQKLKP